VTLQLARRGAPKAFSLGAALDFANQIGDVGQAAKQAIGRLGQWQKALPLVKAAGIVVYGVDDNRKAGDLAVDATARGIRQ